MFVFIIEEGRKEEREEGRIVKWIDEISRICWVCIRSMDGKFYREYLDFLIIYFLFM